MKPQALELAMVPIHRPMARMFRAELLTGSIWSKRLGAHRPLADGLQEVMQELLG